MGARNGGNFPESPCLATILRVLLVHDRPTLRGFFNFRIRRRPGMSKTLTKADIVESIYEETGKNRLNAKSAVETLLEIMKKAIKKDHSLLISGFGKFECYEKNSRKGRNPQTEETITLPPRKVVVFRLSRKFRSELNPKAWAFWTERISGLFSLRPSPQFFNFPTLWQDNSDENLILSRIVISRNSLKFSPTAKRIFARPNFAVLRSGRIAASGLINQTKNVGVAYTLPLPEIFHF